MVIVYVICKQNVIKILDYDLSQLFQGIRMFNKLFYRKIKIFKYLEAKYAQIM
jgi:hypothetical protein